MRSGKEDPVSGMNIDDSPIHQIAEKTPEVRSKNCQKPDLVMKRLEC
jgi:hypothetical protein